MQTSSPDYVQALSDDHPVRVYIEENSYLKKLLVQLAQVDIIKDYQLAYNLFNQIATVDIRYTRKENQLFPYLEKRGWFGPSQGMWSFQDENRKLIKNVRAKLESARLDELKPDLELMISELMRMTQVEEMRLFPNALRMLLPEDWEAMKLGEAEIGWMHKKAKVEAVSNTPFSEAVVGPEGFLKMNECLMTLEQINLMLQFIPFDLTYVDENDKVLFYNRGEDRVFPRSAGVIGRAGRKSVAEFWINFRGKLIHIRYFAVRDHEQKYKGVIEVSQDVTDIKKLEGEKRLLDWNH